MASILERAIEQRARRAIANLTRPSLAFRVDGPVRPLARPRVVRRKGVVRAYTPRSSVTYKTAIAWAARKELGRRSWPRDRTYSVLIVVSRPAAKRGDIDNIAKVVLDALKGTLYKDDGQVRHLEITLHDTGDGQYSWKESLSVTVCTLGAR
jgi:Holliday junction resolvase RusA-like endonuclease